MQNISDEFFEIIKQTKGPLRSSSHLIKLFSHRLYIARVPAASSFSAKNNYYLGNIKLVHQGPRIYVHHSRKVESHCIDYDIPLKNPMNPITRLSLADLDGI